MNNGQQSSQPTGAQGNPQGQAPRKINIFRPEQMRALPEQFSQEEKSKWEAGLKNLWAQLAEHPPESTAHLDAKRKLYDFSRTLTAKLANARAQQQQQATAAGAARPPSQGQPAQAQAGEAASTSNTAQPPQQTRPQPANLEKLMAHVNSFPYVAPASMAAGSPEALRYIHEWKGKYLKALTAMDNAATRLKSMKEAYDKRVAEGRPFTAEEEKDYKEKQAAVKKQHAECGNYVENFRKQQETIKLAAAGNQGNLAQPQVSSANAGGNTNSANPNAGGIGIVPNPGQLPGPTRPQMSVNQPATNPTLQHTQTINGAIETARNQQMAGGRPAMQISMPPTQSQQQMVNQNQNVPANMNMGNSMGQTNIKAEPVAPAANNTAAMQMQQRGSLGGQGMPAASPQSAVPRPAGMPQSAGPQGQPQALSHTDALTHAARSYSNTAPSVMGHSHPNLSVPRDQNVTTNKMPIPKHLPERATQAPQPVAMPSVRPSYTGGANSIGGGVMNQPVINNPSSNGTPAGENEGILTSNKLNELVRQVTGGGNGLDGGQGLSPDVEKVCHVPY